MVKALCLWHSSILLSPLSSFLIFLTAVIIVLSSPSFVPKPIPESTDIDTIVTHATDDVQLEPKEEEVTSTAEEASEYPTLPIFTVFGCAEGSEHSPDKAVDGDLNTYWKCAGTGQHITLGLGGARTITQLDIAWHRGDFMKNDFTIQASTDGAFTDIMSAVSAGDTDGFEKYELHTPVKASSVKVIVNFNVTEKAAINEVVVHGI